MPMNVALIIGGVLAVAAVIAAEILLLPKKRVAGLNRFLRGLRDFLMFKKLYLESIIRFLYILMTAVAFFCGFFLLFSVAGYGRYTRSMAPFGLMLMVLGPVLIRVLYEAVLLRIMIWRNTADINAKLSGDAPQEEEEIPLPAPRRESRRRTEQQAASRAAARQAAAQQQVPARPAVQPAAQQPANPYAAPYTPQYVFCPNCGTRYDANLGACPNCQPQQAYYYPPQQ